VANDEMRQTWAEGAGGWVANEAIFDAVFAPVTAAILDAAGLARGQRVLDVGCGTGTLLAAGAAAGAEVVGIDISPAMADGARRRVPAATLVVGDAQTAKLLDEAPGSPFDRVVSRFGVMFFADPAAAFANIRQATAPGARMVFVCWRDAAENPMFTLGTSVLVDRLEVKPELPVSGEPGPTAFADRVRLAGLLAEAGWDPAISPLDVECDYGTGERGTGERGTGGSDGVEERLATILSTTTGRNARAELEPALGAVGWAALLEDVRSELREHVVDGSVRFPGAMWLVTATNPGQ